MPFFPGASLELAGTHHFLIFLQVLDYNAHSFIHSNKAVAPADVPAELEVELRHEDASTNKEIGSVWKMVKQSGCCWVVIEPFDEDGVPLFCNRQEEKTNAIILICEQHCVEAITVYQAMTVIGDDRSHGVGRMFCSLLKLGFVLILLPEVRHSFLFFPFYSG